MSTSRAHSDALHDIATSLVTAGMALLPGATEDELRDIDPDGRIGQAIDDLNQIKRERRTAQLDILSETVSLPSSGEAGGSRVGRVSGSASAPVRPDSHSTNDEGRV